MDTQNPHIILHPLWCPKLSPLGSPVPDYNRCIQLIDRIKNCRRYINGRCHRMAKGGGTTSGRSALRNGSRHKHTARYPGSGLSVEIKPLLLPVWTIGISVQRCSLSCICAAAELICARAELSY